MFTINRDAMIVSARKPLVDWVNSIDPSNHMNYRDPLVHDESTIYLIEEFVNSIAFEKWLKNNWLEIFQVELSDWCTDESKWPNPLTYVLFNEWIRVSYQSMVFDIISDDPIEYD